SGGPYTQISAQGGLSFVDSGLTNGTKYFYVVSSYNSSAESGNSNEASATPAASTPAAPSGLSATPGNGQVSLSWNAVAGATGYHVNRPTSARAEVQIAAPTATTFVDSGLANGTKYFYVVSAVNGGQESANSAEASATPAAPQPPA